MRTTSPVARISHRILGRVIPTLFAALLLALFGSAARAQAKSYRISQVDIDATVAADGSLAVRETRRFSFDGSFNGVFWRIPVGTYEGREVTLDVTGAGMLHNGTLESFERSASEEPGTYQLTEGNGYVQAKLFSPHENEDVDFVISYTYAGVTSRWADTAELYWKFVSDGWDEPSRKVTCRVHLPVPVGASFVAGDTVRAWGHGVPSGHVDFEGQDVVYTVSEVGTREFAEARVVFPGEWLAQMEPSTEARLQGILDEEQRWADEANAERDRARGRRVRNCVTMGLVAVATSVFAAYRKRKHSLLYRAYYDEQYFREMPSHDHPVVLVSLMEFRERENEEVIGNILAGRTAFGMPASIMRLANEGVIAFDKVEDYDGKMQYRLVETGRVGRAHAHDAQDIASKAVDRATLDLLFDVVAARHNRSTPDAQTGPRYVLMSDFEDTASESTTRYTNGWKAWGKAVADAYTRRGFKTEIDPGATALLVMGILDFAVAVVMGFVAFVNDVPVPLVLLFMALLVAAGIWCIKAELDTMYLHTPEALELMGKTEALKRWLCDFTRLEEAIPTDVVLWNDLLVMATALGVARDVIKQLKVKVPQLLADPAFTSYAWYRNDPEVGTGRRGISPMGSFAKTLTKADGIAHPVSDSSSSSDYDSSDYSSGSGSGGGFSSGGGGGFGGGGGGGAF